MIIASLSRKTLFLNLFRNVLKIPVFEQLLLSLNLRFPESDLLRKMLPNNYQYPSNTIRFAKRNNINYKLDISDYVDWWIYFGLTEGSRSELYKRINKGNVIIDIGTNIGELLMNFAKLTGDAGRVHGFEPDTINFKRCRSNLELNHFTNIQINNIGLGDKKGRLPITIKSESNRGCNRITKAEDTNTEFVNIITLDSYVDENNIEQINLIKIDVEGFELNVLMGAEKSLKKYKPTLFIEVDDNNLREQGHSAKELISFLENIGYKTINAENSEKVTPSDDFTDCHYDILCT